MSGGKNQESLVFSRLTRKRLSALVKSWGLRWRRRCRGRDSPPEEVYNANIFLLLKRICAKSLARLKEDIEHFDWSHRLAVLFPCMFLCVWLGWWRSCWAAKCVLLHFNPWFKWVSTIGLQVAAAQNSSLLLQTRKSLKKLFYHLVCGVIFSRHGAFSELRAANWSHSVGFSFIWACRRGSNM